MTAVKNIRRTKAFKTLLAVGFSEDEAVHKLSKLAKDKETPVTDPLTTLVEGGFTPEDAAKILGVEVKTDKTVRELFDEKVEAAGFSFARGRIYANPDVAEAIIRVHKTGSPEVVQTSGVGHTKAVALFLEESGDVSVQNLGFTG